MMLPKMKRAAPDRATRDTKTYTAKSTPRRQREQPARPYRVLVLAFDRRTEWSRYATKEEADKTAARMRQHGMHAEVEYVVARP